MRNSLTEIIRRTGNKAWIEKREEKLPLTTEIINDSLESLEDFMIRKLLLAENKFIAEKIIPTKNQLVTRAIIRNTTAQNSTKIQEEIKMSLSRIEKSINNISNNR